MREPGPAINSAKSAFVCGGEKQLINRLDEGTRESCKEDEKLTRPYNFKPRSKSSNLRDGVMIVSMTK